MARIINSREVACFIHKTLKLKGKSSDYAIHYETASKRVNGKSVKHNRVVLTDVKTKDMVYATPYHDFGTKSFLLSDMDLMKLTELIVKNA